MEKQQYIGDIGETEFKQFFELFFDRYLIDRCSVRETGRKNIAGLDFYCDRIVEKSTNAWYRGSIEVKTCRYGSFLKRDNDDACESGSIAFELWQDNGKPGWLYEYMFPVDQNKKANKNQRLSYAVKPFSLVYFFCDRYNKPYMCIAFECFAELEKRLKSISPFKLTNSWKQKTGNYSMLMKGTVVGNEWLVPFSEISDLATVTFIDGIPDTEGTDKCSAELVKTRLAYLQKVANDRIVYTDAEHSDENAAAFHRVYSALKYHWDSIPHGYFDVYPQRTIKSRAHGYIKMRHHIIKAFEVKAGDRKCSKR